MSIDQLLTSLNDNLSQLTATMQKLCDAQGATAGKPASPGGDTSSQDGKASQPGAGTKLAKKLTRIFFKDSKTGVIVKQGEPLPATDPDNAVSVAKTKWDQLCEKYHLDPETGKKPESVFSEKEDDDFGDGEFSLDGDGDGDDFGLGLDGEPEQQLPAATQPEMLEALRNLAKLKGKEEVIKILKPYGNANQVPAGDYAKVIKQCKDASK